MYWVDVVHRSCYFIHPRRARRLFGRGRADMNESKWFAGELVVMMLIRINCRLFFVFVLSHLIDFHSITMVFCFIFWIFLLIVGDFFSLSTHTVSMFVYIYDHILHEIIPKIYVKKWNKFTININDWLIDWLIDRLFFFWRIETDGIINVK